MSDPIPPPPPSDPFPPAIPPTPPEGEPTGTKKGFFQSPTTPFPPCGADERGWAVGTHASAFIGLVVPFGNILGPLIIWLIKRPESKYLDEVGKEAVNFHISFAIYMVVSTILAIVLSCLIIPILLPFAVGIAGVVLMIIAIVKTSDGTDYRYPATIRFIK